MDRATVYTQEQARSVDFLFAQRATMIGLGKLAQAAFGSNTVVRGLAVTPNSPAALNVLIGIGEIYSMAQVDATPWGALAADTTDTIVKQGLNMAAQTISTPAPSTSGYSINYLIEAQYQDQDNVPVVLPYYNSANPQQPLNGQGGGGAAQATERQGVCVIQAKAGIAAATGTQTTPSVDAGWTALAVVTVANGQATVTSGNISVPAGVPQLTSLLQMMQTGSAVYAVDTSTTPNTITFALTPAITSYSDGEPVRFKAANNNTGPCTINWGGGSIALNGANGALQGGEILAGKQYEVVYNSTTGTATLIGQAAGALQVAPATQSQHAAQLAQLLSVSGPQAVLSYTSSTTLTLSRARSGLVYSPGYGIVTVPSAGLTYTAAGLTSNTLYYVYLNPNGGNPSLSLSTTGHTTDATGVEVQTGNNSMVLVGMAYALSATTVESTVRSWSNDPGYSAISNLSSNSSSTSTTPTNVNTGMITPFLLWAKEIPYVSITAGMSVSSANFAVATVVAVDNAVVQGPVASSTPPAANEVLSASVSIPVNGLAEGHHTTNMFGYVVGSVTGTWSGNSGTMSATVLSLCISPHK